MLSAVPSATRPLKIPSTSAAVSWIAWLLARVYVGTETLTMGSRSAIALSESALARNKTA